MRSYYRAHIPNRLLEKLQFHPPQKPIRHARSPSFLQMVSPSNISLQYQLKRSKYKFITSTFFKRGTFSSFPRSWSMKFCPNFCRNPKDQWPLRSVPSRSRSYSPYLIMRKTPWLGGVPEEEKSKIWKVTFLLRIWIKLEFLKINLGLKGFNAR